MMCFLFRKLLNEISSGIILAVFFLMSSFILYSQDKNNFEVIKGFCHNEKDSFSNGITVKTLSNKLYSLSDGELIFYNKNRKDSINYRSTSVAVIEDKTDKKRYSYKIENYSFNSLKEKYAKNDELASFPNAGSNNIFIEIEEPLNKKIINPLSVIDLPDEKQPFIDDIYFITQNNEYVSLVKSYTSAIKKGGKIFIKCFDRINNSYSNITPYKIRLLIDGKELSNTIFNALDKNKGIFKLNEKRFHDVYKDNEPFVYYLTDYNGLPGIIGFIIEVEDIKGNKTVYKRALKIIFPE